MIATGVKPKPAERPERLKALAQGTLLYLGPLVLLLLLWQLVVTVRGLPPYILPSPGRVAAAFRDLLADGTLPAHLWASSKRLLVGSLAGFALAVPLGYAIALFRPFRILFTPIISLTQPIPGLGWVPLAILWFGLNDRAVNFIIFLSAFFPILLNTITGVRAVDRNLLRVARVMRASPAMVVTDVIIPGALPYIMTGIRIGFGYGWRALVGGEMIATTTGLGFMIFNARNYLKTDEVLVGMLTIGVFWSIVENQVLRRIEAKTIERWGSVK